MKLDQNFIIDNERSDHLKEYDLINAPVKFYGLNYIDEEHLYQRLSIKDEEAISKVSTKVVALSKNPAGGQVHFLTNSKKLVIKASMFGVAGLSGMTLVAQIGFDCYVGSDYNHLLFYNTARFEIGKNEYEFTLFEGEEDQEKLVVINFPLYGCARQVCIKIDENAYLKKPREVLSDNNKIVIYGTSITQGGCASRPGLCYTNILTRRLLCEIINLGFSGNAFGENEIAQVIAKITDASMFIIDYEANGGTNGKMELTLEDFIKTIRKENKKVPIVIISRIKYLYDDLRPTLGKRREELRQFQEQMVKRFNDLGDHDVYYINGSTLLGEKYDEYTNDTIHPNDLGFMNIANNLEPQLREILEKYKH